LKFDENITSPARLAIIACLVSGEARSFTDMKRAAGLGDGNLHVQTRRLAGAGYIEIIKGQRGGRSWTRFRITEHGLAALKLYVRKLETILASEVGVIRPARPSPRPDKSQVWSS
jgi:DNA-binding MarR family transcriptional regulator